MTTGPGSNRDRVPCAHCEREIRPDGQGGWVHLSGLYTCVDETNAPLPTYAWPAESTPPADGPPLRGEGLGADREGR